MAAAVPAKRRNIVSSELTVIRNKKNPSPLVGDLLFYFKGRVMTKRAPEL